MSVLDFLKPAPHIKEIENTQEVKKLYKYWRIRTLYSMYAGYALYYFTRKSVTFAMPAMAKDLGLDKFELGMFGTILSLTYGASKFLSGVLSDKSNPRYFMSIGLVMTGIFNIFFGFSSTFILFAIFWGLNGWFQGWGWPPCAKLLTHWYSQTERGSWWSVWNTSHNVGGALIPIVVAYVAQMYTWRYSMYVPGIICILGGLFLINRLRDTPRSLGLPTIEDFKNDYPSGHHEKDRVELTAKEILLTYVIKNKYIWFLTIASFFVYVIRTAVNDWTLLYLVEAKGYSYLVSGGGIFWFEMGGFAGSLVAGWGSDWIFKGKRGPVNVIFAVCVTFAVLAMWKLPGGYFVLDMFLIFLIGFFIFGPQMLIGVAAAELSHKKAAGTATGFLGWFGYLGAAMAGGPLGAIIKYQGWNGFFFILCLCGIVAAVSLLPLWSAKTNPKFEKM